MAENATAPHSSNVILCQMLQTRLQVQSPELRHHLVTLDEDGEPEKQSENRGSHPINIERNAIKANGDQDRLTTAGWISIPSNTARSNTAGLIPRHPPTGLYLQQSSSSQPQCAVHSSHAIICAGPSAKLLRKEKQYLECLLREDRMVLDDARILLPHLLSLISGPLIPTHYHSPPNSSHSPVPVHHRGLDRSNAVVLRSTDY